MPPKSTFPHPRHRGGQAGNVNALKHGFYTRRIKKSHLNGLETTDITGLIEEIALIRVFTRRLVETCDSEADAYELADFLRILCLASSTISRVIRTQYLLDSSGAGMDDEIAEAIRQVNLELRHKLPATSPGNQVEPASPTLNAASPLPLT